MAANSSPYLGMHGHSRNSSGASTSSSPITSTFSTRTHSRFPSSSSSLATSPDSPVNHAKSHLHDLVEEPAEREDILSHQDIEYVSAESFTEEPLCICDTPFCEHRQTFGAQTSPSTPEWTSGDENAWRRGSGASRTIKRSRSGELLFEGKAASRASRHWPSISNRWRDRKPTTSVSGQSVRSAPPSRESSVRRPSISQSLASHLGPRQTFITPERQIDSAYCDTWAPPPTRPSESLDIPHSCYSEDPIDREGRSSTPLLPPLLSELRNSKNGEQQPSSSSSSIAAKRSSAPVSDVQALSPMLNGMPTPPLSAKPSVASFGMGRSSHVHSRSDVAPMSKSEEPDQWAIRLGHANFEIEPRPYLPQICNRESCNRLLQDWEAARVEYMRVAARVSEHYGPSSRTYKLTEEKWSEIDYLWRMNLRRANAEAEANGQTPTLQSLAETQPLAKIPSLVDPQQPEKFLKVAEADIVGPMVQYSKIQQPPSPKKTSFVKLFTDPSSLFGRSSPGARR
ncbi:hypothetical protein LTR37_002253 [Vermiconidia calcicola]|uniref:Uncharacterized protein n=1 Tax=Vermiconidia calcicola TaxID=1690605 RepID=A0ACC3NU03_9PEZI|nr:hypothetical protein LTR37_002253 [Vermiconidia calcicola]